MFHLFAHAFLLSLGAMVPIINPLGHAPMFYMMTINDTIDERRRVARRTSLYVFLILIVSLLTGQYILHFFGVTINDIRMGGGLIVAAAAWKMLGNVTRLTDSEESAAMEKADITLTPMATPILAGPGAMSLAIGLSSYGHSPIHYAGYIAGFAALALITVICFYSSDYLAKYLGDNAIGAINRILGFLILAIGVDLMITGLKNTLFASHLV